MPRTRVVWFREEDGTVPMLEWLDSLSPQAQAKCLARIRLLMDRGHELRRPNADLLRSGIYELRVRFGKVNYRMLYFVHGRGTAVISHGFAKEQTVPEKEIERALARKQRFTKDPSTHSFEGL